MVFSSLTFLSIFLPAVLLLHTLLPSIRLKNALLIAASLVFYAYGEPVYVFLMLLSTVVNYGFGRLLGVRRTKPALALAVAFNLVLLGVFKYTDMLLSTVNRLFSLSLPLTGILLPIGISFFTFQTMSYLIDIYRGQTPAQKNYFNLLLYISFFPQLIAGPIVKYHDIEQEITRRQVTAQGLAWGMRRFVIGLSKKVLISNAAALVADRVFALSSPDGAAAWAGAFAYLLQIYYDFSGYSDMAIGMGWMFGFHFLENFDYPYSAASVRVFWRKWHISLSTWFKEYLYIPLGGNRKGRLRACLNKLIVFFCTGLWHGANWTFVIWGLFHGFFLLLEEFLPIKKLPRVLGHLYTLLVVTVGFVIFRADAISQGFSMIAAMFTRFPSGGTALQYATPLTLFLAVIGVIGAFPWKPALEKRLAAASVRVRSAAEYLSYAAALLLLALCILNLSGGSYNPFIYFRF